MSTQVYYNLFLILFLVVFIISIIAILKNPFYSKPAKLLWIAVCLFMPFLGSLIYYFYRKG